MNRILIEVQDLHEARIALEAVKAFHDKATLMTGNTILPASPPQSQELADRLYEIICDPHLGEGGRVVVKTLGKAPAKDWVPIKLLEDALVSAGYAEQGQAWEKVRAWVGRLSADINGAMPEEITKAAKGALNLLVTRRLFSDGKVRYRLTAAGRAAAERLLSDG